jgi:hypothetical protein
LRFGDVLPPVPSVLGHERLIYSYCGDYWQESCWQIGATCTFHLQMVKYKQLSEIMNATMKQGSASVEETSLQWSLNCADLQLFFDKIGKIDWRKSRREDVFRGLDMYHPDLLQYLDLYVFFHSGNGARAGFSKVMAKVLISWTTEEFQKSSALSEEVLAAEMTGRLQKHHQPLIPDSLVQGMMPKIRSTYDAAVDMVEG